MESQRPVTIGMREVNVGSKNGRYGMNGGMEKEVRGPLVETWNRRGRRDGDDADGVNDLLSAGETAALFSVAILCCS
jgi:hypothetical protein